MLEGKKKKKNVLACLDKVTTMLHIFLLSQSILGDLD